MPLAATAVSLGALFDAEIHVRKHGFNTAVGFVESFRGLASMALALPIGCCVDKCVKSRFLRWNVLVAVVAMSVLLLGVSLGHVALITIGAVAMATHNQVIDLHAAPSQAAPEAHLGSFCASSRMCTVDLRGRRFQEIF